MARVRMFGTEFNADPVEDLGDGTWRMRSRAHTARTSNGTLFIAKQSEIIEMAAAEEPEELSQKSDNGAALEAAMADEREALPTFAEIDAANGNAKKREGRVAAYIDTEGTHRWQDLKAAPRIAPRTQSRRRSTA